MIIFLLSAFGVALLVSLLACAVALRLFPWFRSGEKKAGDFKPDQSGSSGSHQIEVSATTAKKGAVPRSKIRARSTELPLVGGSAMVLAVLVASGVAGYLLNFTFGDWELLGLVMATMLGFGLVGLIDDILKVFRGKGVTEIQKFVGIFVVAFGAAAAFNRLLTSPGLSARLAYSPYRDLPLLGSVLVHVRFAWLIFFLVTTVTVTTTTALAVDFSDGMDGLCGGLLLSSALSYSIVLLDEGTRELWPLTIALLAMAGATLGYLPFNWPSSWRGGPNPSGKRRARLIMGDTGSLALGGLLAIVAIVSRLEFLLLFVGGVFVLEGVSALVSARILVGFFRRFLFVERFNSSRGFPHTEFPLPFLATPMHHHFELLAWDRKRLVYGAWALGAGLGLLGIASVMGPFTWERYLARFTAFLVLLLVWQFGPWTRAFFVGLTPLKKSQPDAPRYLALYYGAPFKLFGWPLYARIDVTHATVDALDSAAERLSLWQLMNVFDARSLLGYYCFQAREYDDALRIWDRIPQPNLDRRKEIANMVIKAKRSVAEEAIASRGSLERVVADQTPPLNEILSEEEQREAIQATHANGSSGSHAHQVAKTPPLNYSTVLPGPTTRVTAPPNSPVGGRASGAPAPLGSPVPGDPNAELALNSPNSDPNSSAWRAVKPSAGIQPTPRLHPVDDAVAPDITVTPPPPPSHTPSEMGQGDRVLWSVGAWVGANPQAVDPLDSHASAEDDDITMPRKAARKAQESPDVGAASDSIAASVAPSYETVAPTFTVAPSEQPAAPVMAEVAGSVPVPVSPVVTALAPEPSALSVEEAEAPSAGATPVDRVAASEAPSEEQTQPGDGISPAEPAELAMGSEMADDGSRPSEALAPQTAPEETVELVEPVEAVDPMTPAIVPTLTPKSPTQPDA